MPEQRWIRHGDKVRVTRDVRDSEFADIMVPAGETGYASYFFRDGRVQIDVENKGTFTVQKDALEVVET